MSVFPTQGCGSSKSWVWPHDLWALLSPLSLPSFWNMIGPPGWTDSGGGCQAESPCVVRNPRCPHWRKFALGQRPCSFLSVGIRLAWWQGMGTPLNVQRRHIGSHPGQGAAWIGESVTWGSLLPHITTCHHSLLSAPSFPHLTDKKQDTNRHCVC